MEIMLGNPSARLSDGRSARLGAPATTYISMPRQYFDDQEADAPDATDADVEAIRSHIAGSVYRQGITRLSDLGTGHHEALLSIIHPFTGTWQAHSESQNADWVSAPGHPVLERHLAQFFGADVGVPRDHEDTHWSRFGPPGMGPLYPSGSPIPDVQAAIGAGPQGMRDQLAQAGLGWQNTLAVTGTATATSATSLTMTAAGWTVNAFTGLTVVSITGAASGLILSNTATVLTIDRWQSITNPGGAAATTPTGTTGFVILAYSPVMFVGLTANATAPATPTLNASLPGEIVTAGGGLVRKIAPVAHTPYSAGGPTAGATTTTHTPVFTANGSDTLPVTVAQSAQFPTMVVAANMLAYQSPLSVAATMSASGDQLTETITYTGT